MCYDEGHVEPPSGALRPDGPQPAGGRAAQLVARNIGHPVGLSSLLLMAWLVSAVATLGGALGSGMEDDGAVKAAAYGVRQRQRFDKSD